MVRRLRLGVDAMSSNGTKGACWLEAEEYQTTARGLEDSSEQKPVDSRIILGGTKQICPYPSTCSSSLIVGNRIANAGAWLLPAALGRGSWQNENTQAHSSPARLGSLAVDAPL